MLLERIKGAVKETLILIEQEEIKPEYTKYSWTRIKETFEQELPMLSVDAIEKFRMNLVTEASRIGAVNTDNTVTKRKYSWKRRRLPDGFPSHFSMTVHIIDYLKICKNMTASKADIYNAIKDKYSSEIQAIPHRSRGRDIKMSELEYRLEWACTLLTMAGKTIGRTQDAALPKTYIKLISTLKFTDAEIVHYKQNSRVKKK